MRGHKGYTIIEVMLFLAISGGLLVIAFAGFSGKQASTQFSQAMQDIQISIRDTLNDAQKGTYPNPANTTCDLSGGGRPTVHSLPGASLGSSEECIYLGKVLTFGDAGNDASYRVFSIVGKRDNPAGTTTGAMPAVAEPLTEEKTLPWGVRVLKKANPAGTLPPVYYANLVGSVNGLDSTRQQPVVFAGKQFYDTVIDQTTYMNDPNSYQSSQFANGASADGFIPVILCFERSDRQQIAQITVGADGSNGVTTKLTFDVCEGV